MPFMDLQDRSPFEHGRPRPALVIGLALVVCLVAGIAAFRFVQSADERTFSIEESSSSSSGSAQSSEEESAAPATVIVYVSGAVAAPGLVELPEGARVGDAVTAAGGFGDTADPSALNLARVVEDGEQVDVPTIDEQSTAEATGAAAGNASSATTAPSSSGGGSGLVNINTAGTTELETLPGVGPSTAQKIVDDRAANGSFKKKEDLKRVSGIGDKKYAQLEAYITV